MRKHRKIEGRRIQKKIDEAENGVFTLEAAVVCSITILCLLLVIYSALYYHDRVVLEGILQRAAQQAWQGLVENQNLETGEADWNYYYQKSLLWRLFPDSLREESWIRGMVQSQLEGKLLVSKNVVVQAAVSVDQVCLKFQAETTLPGFSLLGLHLGNPVLQGGVTRKGFEAEELLRLVKGVLKK